MHAIEFIAAVMTNEGHPPSVMLKEYNGGIGKVLQLYVASHFFPYAFPVKVICSLSCKLRVNSAVVMVSTAHKIFSTEVQN